MRKGVINLKKKEAEPKENYIKILSRDVTPKLSAEFVLHPIKIDSTNPAIL